MEAVYVEMLGFVAGATTLCSSVPQLVANLRDPALAKGQSAARNALQCTGNAMWLVYALSVGSVAMTTFAGLGSVMALALLVQVVKSNGQAATVAWSIFPEPAAALRSRCLGMSPKRLVGSVGASEIETVACRRVLRPA